MVSRLFIFFSILFPHLSLYAHPAVQDSAKTVEVNGELCLSHKKAPNCVTINASRSVDPEGAELIYRWDMGDGFYRVGKIIDHCYEKPGKYRVTLSTVDKVSTVVKNEEAVVNITIDSVPTLFLNMPTTGTTNSILTFSTGGPTIKKCKTASIIWDFDDGSSGSGVIALHEYRNPGIYKVTLIINGEGYSCQACGYKYLEIIKEEKDEVLEFKNITTSPHRFEINRYAKGILYDHNDKSERVIDIWNNKNLDLEPDKIYSLFAYNTTSFTGVYRFNTNNKSQEKLKNLEMTVVDSLLDLRAYTLDRIYFESNQYELTGDAQQVFNKNLRKLRYNPFVVIEIGSHTDPVGSPEYNLLLSGRRTKAISNYVHKKEPNISKRIISIRGYGEERLTRACKSCSEVEKLANRRTEFRIMGTVNNHFFSMKENPDTNEAKQQELVEKYGDIKKDNLTYTIRIDQNNGVRYYLGDFSTLEFASEFLEEARKDESMNATIIALFNEEVVAWVRLEAMLRKN